MPSTRKKLPGKLPFSLAIACGCGGPTLSDVYVPRPKHQNPSMRPTPTYYHRKSANNFHRASSTSTVCSTTTTTTTTSTCRGDDEGEEAGTRSSSYWNSATTSFSQGASNSISNSDSAAPQPSSSTTKKAVWGCRICRESVAVVKESRDPYLDFHHSMLQMIVEKEIYAQEDLRRLLHCFLSLNSPSNHPTIVHAFCDATSGAGWESKDHVPLT